MLSETKAGAGNIRGGHKLRSGHDELYGKGGNILEEGIMTVLKEIVKKADVLKLRKCYNKIRQWQWRERVIRHGGKKPEYYVIRRSTRTAGFFSYFVTNLGGIAEAERRGLKPVIDMCNYPNPYLLDGEIGKVNLWEYFFEQPRNDSRGLNNILKKESCVLSDACKIPDFPDIRYEIFTNQGGELDHWKAVCARNICLKPRLAGRIDEAEQKLLSGKGRVLGVSLRAGAYVLQKPKNHPVQPTLEQAIGQVGAAMEGGRFDSIYLTVDDNHYIEAFRKHFGSGRLILYEREILGVTLEELRAGHDAMLHYKAATADAMRRHVEEYVVSMFLLNRCQGLVTSMTSGSMAMMCFPQDFDYTYIFNLGHYR